MKRKKILVECHHGIGDLVMTFPAVLKIKEIHPYAEIHMLVRNEQQGDFVKNIGLAEEYYELDVTGENITKIFSVLLKIKKQKYDIAYAFGQSPRGWDVLLLKLGGCQKVISIKHEKPLCGKYMEIDVSNCVHRVEQHLKCVGVTNTLKPQEALISFPEDFDESVIKKYIIKTDKKRIGVCFGTGDFFYRKGLKKIFYNAKEWESQKFYKLIKNLEKHGYQVILFGGKKEAETLNEKQLSDELINLTGKLTLLETVALLKQCSVVVGADTGIMHCAAAVGTSTVTIFGATDEKIIGPYSQLAHYVTNKECTCRPCYGTREYKIRNCKKRECLLGISEQEVLNKIIDIIEEKNE